MHTLFNTPPSSQRGVAMVASYANLQRRLRSNVYTVINHCRESFYAVRSNHLLVTLLQTLGVPPTLPVFEYHDRVVTRAPEAAKALGIGSALWRTDTVANGHFYGRGTEEVLIAVEERFSLFNVESTWRDLVPVKVLRHERTSLSINQLDGRESDAEYGLAVIQIDVVKLAHQYRCWYQEQLRAEVDFLQTPMQFVSQYPLPAMLMSHLDLAMFNRCYALSQGRPTEGFSSSWPFYLNDYSNQVDAYLRERLDTLKRSALDYSTLMSQLELVFAPTLREMVVLPRVAQTRQITWALALARLPVIKLLVWLDHHGGGNRNRNDNSTIRKGVREMHNDGDLRAALSGKTFKRIRDEIEHDVMEYL